MKPIEEFLLDLSRKDIKLWVENKRLRCNAPKETLTPEIRVQLSKRKAEIIAFLQKAKVDAEQKLKPITPFSRDTHGALPLSWAQERLWFLDQLQGQSATYNIPGAVRVTGKLNFQTLEQSVSEIVRRHEVLRTSFKSVNGISVQVIEPEANLAVGVVNLHHLCEVEQKTQVQQLASQEAMTPFDLSTGSLLRVTVLELSASESVVLLTMHHIISDGWSMGLLVNELFVLYQAFSQGETSPLAELPIQYADFTLWQRQWLSTSVLEKQLNYWLSHLAGAPALLELPTDRPRPAIQSYRGATYEFQLNAQLTQKLQILSRESGTTLFMTLLGAFATLLYRYSGQSDILIGSPIANRNRTEIESLIGFFVNTLVLKTSFESEPSFAELLTQVREVTLKAYDNQDVPFEQVVDALKPERSLSHSPLFQVMFALENTPMGELEFPELTLTPLKSESVIAKFDLTLSIEETTAGLVSSWEYNLDLFDCATITRMASHFHNILEAIVENPQQRVSQLPLLSQAERHQLLMEWNDTATEYPSDKCIHQLFEQQVEKTPDAVALVFEEQQLTYRQLNQRSNQLAQHLRSLGVGPEVLVGICVERSIEMVVGLLGILKAGGAYVPLDPTYPQERLSYMLADSGVQVLLTQRSLLASLPSHQAQVLCLDSDWYVIACESVNNPSSGVTSENLAYVIYTSGSTGQPKGVLIEHKNVIRLFAATQSWYHFNANDVSTNFHSIAFDFSVWEIWGALFYGGRLVIVPYWTSRDPQKFYNLLCEQNITVLNQTPSAFRQLINLEKSDDRRPQLSLRLIIFGGEALELQSLKPWFEQRGDRSPQLVNMYGITETTVHVTYRPLTIKDLNSSASVIGCPIPDLQMYILDQYLQPVPIGVKGQMYVGGHGLARGYLNRQQLTAERFIPNPIHHQLASRLYQTGDLARYLPNGDIEYLGRIDNQLKVRGFRIELGEIEAVLNIHPQIHQSVVLATEDIPGNKRLVAYVVTESESLKASQLREQLKQKLPEYMVPSAFVFLDALPLTPNGKVDRKALNAIDVQHLELNTDFVAPRTPEEELLAQIWSQVLGVEQVGIYDNFFGLGGDSLLSVQVLALANKSGLGLTLQKLYENQTINDLAKVLQQSDLALSIVKTAPLSLISSEERQSLPNGVEDAYPLTQLQLGMLFHSEYAPEAALYHDVMSYSLKAPLNVEILHSAIEHIVARHPVLRTSITITQFTQPLQLVHSQVSIELTVEDLSSLPLEEQQSNIATWIEQEKQRPFSFDAASSLARFHIHQRSDDTFNFTFSCHHAILDGWSVATLMMELVQHYFFLLDKTAPPLKAAPNLTFRDYVALEQKILQSQECKQYWHEELADFTVTLLPRWAGSQQHNSVEQVNEQEVEISPALSAQLKQFATKAGVPLKSVLLAAHMNVMSFLTNQADITTGVVTHGRPAVEDTERVLGLFLNTIPLRMLLSGGTWVELVEQTFKKEREALPFQQYPLAQLQQELGSGQPLFETIFNYVNFHVDQGLSRLDKLEIKGGQFFEQTNFAFAAQFFLNPITSEIKSFLSYDPSQFSFEQVRSISSYYKAVLMAIVTQPQEQYEQVCLLSETERHQLLTEWNDTKCEYPQDKCIHQLFEEQVERTPLSVAVVFENQQLTYQQLNQRANQLAYYLQGLGVGSEVLVGICAEHSIEMVVGLLGILKAGGAYVPLDPNYPQERLSYMLADSGVEILLTQHYLLESLPENQAQVLCLDTDWGTIEQQNQDNLDARVEWDNLAYVIYTSGSTGQAKGVAIEHCSVVNFLIAMQQQLGCKAGDTLLSVTSISFDIAVLELFLPLAVGAKVVLVSREVATDGRQLLQQLSNSHATFMQATPATWQMLLAASWQGSPQLTILCGGEALPRALAQQLRERGTLVWNQYGPTETTIWSTIHQVDEREGTVPIGRAIANTKVYILDSHLQPVPIGVAGELYIGGVGVARGYLNRPETTAEWFMTNPFREDERLYRTGDLARYLPDGNIEYIGRIDHQVKIRGFRIELGEIESVLNAQGEVESCVVIATENNPGNKRLVAYIVTKSESLRGSQLREQLKQKLPEYMVPSAFVFLDALPLTPNGKVDRKALPVPDGEISRDNEYLAPRTQSEEIIANIFSSVLSVQNVGIHDNFFELGGHSLLATQLISRLRQAFEVEVPLRALYEAPTVEQLDQILTALRSNKQGLSLPPIEAVARDTHSALPLSWAQERLWFLDQLQEQSATYNVPAAIRVTGTLNKNAFEQTLSEIVRRHEVLRTSFKSVNGTPVQVIEPEANLAVGVVNLHHLCEVEQKTQVQQLASQEAMTPFDLSTGPLLRVTVLELSASASVMLLTMHHIISDGWSMGLLLNELSVLYQAFSQGETSPLAELPIQYADFTLWQRQWLSTSVLEKQLNYWLSHLAGAPALLELPTDRPRPAIQSYRGATYEFQLNAQLTQKLQILSRESGTTLFMTLLGAFATLLYRYSGQSDILIGSPIANRNRTEIESLIGFFVNTLVLKTSFESEPSFAELLTQVREVTLKAYDNQDVPFEQVVDALKPERSLSHSPLFQVMFVLQNAPMGELEFPELTLTPLKSESVIAKFDLTLSIEETTAGLVSSWEYNLDLFDCATITRMASHFYNILEAIVENPQQRVSQLPLLSQAERHQLLVEWNDTATEYPSDKCIHQLFEQQVEKTPDAVALVFEEQQLTYRQLNQRSNQLAQHLRSLGVGPEVLVGICVERSIEMVVGLLGILKAGGAYVPLDPTYPQERLSYMLADSGVQMLLTQRSLLASLPSHEAQVLCLDTDWEIIEQHSQDNLDARVGWDNLAYVMYTSGSTGQPKGVSIIHRGVVRLVKETNYASFNSQEVFLHMAPISFDASTVEIWSSLLNGAKLAVMYAHTPTLEEIAGVIEKHKVTTLLLTTALFHLMVEQQLEKLKSVRQLLTGGDVLSPPHVEKVIKFLPECQLVNGYGPTENTAFTCCYQVKQSRVNGTSVPIGRPIANTQIYILDEHLQAVPIGVPGELYTGGDGLARDYLNRPELTQKSFIPNPFDNSKSKSQRSKLYKTGDLARYLPDGNIEFLGRIDNQVKIRGFRIELGEVEAVLNNHPQIQQAVAIAREDIPGNKRLVAYVVFDESLSTKKLREYLKQKLPEHMVPSAFVFLDALPLTPNGKVDRKALPVPDGEISRDNEYLAPRTQSEEIIANIFSSVLSVQNVGIHDNFFELGGHSLLATQLISRLRQAFEVEVPLRALFEAPTVEQLDQILTALRSNKQGLSLPPIEAVARDTHSALPLSWAQERLWFLDQLQEQSATYNVPAAIRVTGTLNKNAFEQTLSEIVRRHEVLRTSFKSVNGTPVQVIEPEANLAVGVVNLHHLCEVEQKTQVQQLASQEAMTPFDLSTGPLLRVTVLELSASASVMLLTMHHIISDGWSMGLLLNELSVLYQAFSQGETSPLAELPIQYADFTLWQRQWLSTSVLEKQLNYWLSHLAGAPALLELPTDRPRPAIQSYRGATYEFQLNAQLTQKLQILSRESGTTLFMTLLGAFATLLYRYSGQSDILIGSPIANRNRTEIESLIGFFVNTLVLKTSFESEPSFAELLTQVREVTLKAYDNQDVPFEQVVDALKPERSLSHSPLFQVMFVLQNAPMGELEFPELTLTPLKSESVVAQFDLTLSIEETTTGLVSSWEYNLDLFDCATITRMASHFHNILEAIVENPQQRVSQLPLLSQAERHQLLVEWNDTATEYPSDKCIHQLFEQQVEKTPDAVALVFEEQQLTYRQLNQRSNQLAQHLRSLGVRPEVLVGICVERSIEMVVGLLGILKAGGAYVPLDPTYPQERLSYMLADSGVQVLLTQRSLLASLPSHQAQVLCLDSDWYVIACESVNNPSSGVTSENLAYVIYTSGSTGQPKGVAIEHQALVNYTLSVSEQFNLLSSDRMLQFASLSFDVVVEELFPTWLSGASVVLCPALALASWSSLVSVIEQQSVTTLEVPAAYWNPWVDSLDRTADNLPSSLRLVLVGSEKVSAERAAKWQDLGVGLASVYGLTEVSVTSTLYHLRESAQAASWNYLPIGQPIANTELYVLDAALQPVPVGVPGELYIGGNGLARGYLNRPELTAERFIANPFSNDPGDRLYKTGDLVRYLDNGNLEYIDRIDNQVKIRGFRIELGEIESMLNAQGEVESCVVIATENNPGNKCLVAYIVTKSESLRGSQLREQLKQKLPEYMVPSAFVLLDALPLTLNGKVDRKALPVPDGEINREGEYVLPTTPTQEIIANIFGQVLGVELVGIHDNFFELGGHSLLATQLISRLRQAFEVEVPLRALFEAPTVEQLDQILTALRSNKQGLSLPPIEAVARDTHSALPLSWAQERLWFLDQLQEQSATYNVPAAIRVTGTLNKNAFEQTLSEIVRRHEVLRTSFKLVNGISVQVIEPEANLAVGVVNLHHLCEVEQKTQVQQLASQEAMTPFDLSTGPLLRVTVLELSASESVMLLTMHHIISDGWSMGLLLNELSVLYQAFSQGETSPLAELPIQYADFTLWQRQWLSTSVLEKQLNYWLSHLAGAPALLELPTDRPRPAIQSYRGATYEFQLNAQLTQKLQILSRESGTTLFMTLLGAFATLLYRYSGQSDILIGSPIANRNRKEIESLIGFFVNTLVLKTSFESEPSFAELLTQVREVTLKAYDNQDVPFEQVVDALKPERSLSHSPLFQVMFALENTPMGELEFPELTLTPLKSESVIAKFDLTLSIEETTAGLVSSWEYNLDLFDCATITRMASHFHNILEAIVENPQQRVSQLPLLSQAERHQLLMEWNDTATEYPSDKCIHQLFEQQVEKTPDAVALVFEEQQLTYRQLNQRSNQLAQHLHSLGVGPEVLVGICVERSIEMVVGLLGILKAGGAYVPLDPTYPQERLSYMLADSGVQVLLTQRSLLASLPSHQAQVLCLDSDWYVIACESVNNPSSGVTSENLAYVIYTSGSTGQPKGVLIEHKNVIRLFAATQSWYHFNANDVSTNFHSIAFDFSVWEIWGALFYGGRLVIVPYWTSRDPQKFYNLLCEQNITVLNQTPSAFRQLINLEKSDDRRPQLSLRLIIFGGEALELQSLKPWFEQRGDRSPQLVNMYGITETTVHVTYRPLTIKDLNSSASVIGCPIPDLQMYILDQYLQPVPIGVKGQMYVGGHGLARGYLNRQQLTAERFIPNPIHHQLASRLYQTGDLARYLPNGDIEYLGRIDNQLKVRGFRIELGEIEAVLNIHPQIHQSVVLATEDIPGNKRLVAYVVTESESLKASQLREQLKQKLPEYMVPSAFVFLDALPLTPNGKVDRKALNAIDGEISPREYVRPRNNMESRLAQIWSNVLNVDTVGVRDNFFELGGHSLFAVRLMAQIQQQFETNLPLATLFQSPTIEEMANVLRQQTDSSFWFPLVPIRQTGSKQPFFCVPGGGGNLIYFYDLARHLGPDQPLYGLQARGLDGQSKPYTRVEDMAAYYIEAIQTVQPQGPYFLGGHSFGGYVAFEMGQQLLRQGHEVALIALLDTAAQVVSDVPHSDVDLDEASKLIQIVQLVERWLGKNLEFSSEVFQNLNQEEQFDYVKERLIMADFLPPETGTNQVRGLIQVFDANRQAMMHYSPHDIHLSRIALFRASEEVDESDTAIQTETESDPAWGWSKFSAEPIDIQWVPGDHITMMSEPYVQVLAQRLKTCIKKAQTDGAA